MTVSKRTRYEVLKRDDYTCRYCGATAPAAVITIDHVTPVSLGGSDDPSNLVTACRDCNYGKASSNPDAALVAGVSDDALRFAAAFQSAVDAMKATLGVDRAAETRFSEVWNGYHTSKGEQIELPDDWRASLQRWMTAGLPLELIEDAIHRAMRANVPHWVTFKYAAKICWNRVTELQEKAKAEFDGPPAPVATDWHLLLEDVVDGRVTLRTEQMRWAA